jgi:hypothetical protein
LRAGRKAGFQSRPQGRLPQGSMMFDNEIDWVIQGRALFRLLTYGSKTATSEKCSIMKSVFRISSEVRKHGGRSQIDFFGSAQARKRNHRRYRLTNPGRRESPWAELILWSSY